MQLAPPCSWLSLGGHTIEVDFSVRPRSSGSPLCLHKPLTAELRVHSVCGISFLMRRTCQTCFTFDTINLDSMIVCGRPASPHDLVHELNAKRGLLRALR